MSLRGGMRAVEAGDLAAAQALRLRLDAELWHDVADGEGCSEEEERGCRRCR